MANCYLNMDTKYHPDALALYQDILKTDNDNVQALQVGGIPVCTIAGLVRVYLKLYARLNFRSDHRVLGKCFLHKRITRVL
jgi:hypothetical protein